MCFRFPKLSDAVTERFTGFDNGAGAWNRSPQTEDDMKHLRLKETPRAGGFNYTVFEADKPIAAWHSNRQVAGDVYVTIDSNGCFITHRTMPPKEIYGVAKNEYFDRNVATDSRGMVTI